MESSFTEAAVPPARAGDAAIYKTSANERVLHDVFRTRRGVLTRFAERLTRNRFDAEDLVQRAFLRACERNLQMPAEQLVRWLTTVIRRLAIDRLRHDAVHLRFAELQWSLCMHVEAESVTPDDVTGWICTLPDALRRTFLLWRAGVPYQAIALAHGVPLGTVSARVLRAKAQLRALCHDNDGS
jgi:RNA polymerase sigma-70 factor (ECF subfamily)